MIKIFFKISIILFLIPAFANSSPNSNIIDLGIVDYSSAALQQTLKQALQQKVIQISNNPAVVNSPIIRNALSKADRFVISYQYKAPATPNNNLMLHIELDTISIEQLLKQVGSNIKGNSSNSRFSMLLQISGINDLNDYVQVAAELKQIPLIQAVAIKAIEADSLVLKLVTEGDTNQMLLVFKKNPHFIMDHSLQTSLNENLPIALSMRWCLGCAV